MDAEVSPPVQITTSISDDTLPSGSLFTSSYNSDGQMASFRSNSNVGDRAALKVPLSVPSGVANGGLVPRNEDGDFEGNFSSDISPQQYPPTNVDGKIDPASSFSEILNQKSPRSVGDNENEVSSSSSIEEDISAFLSGTGLRWTEKKTSRVGQDFQVTQLPDAGSYLTFQEDDFDQLEQLLLADQIWDPMRATIEGTNDYVHENCPSNRKEAALEFLHQHDYNEALISKEEISKLNVLDGSDWTLSEHENFRRLMQLTRHNVNSVAKSMGKSINNCLTVYYKIINVRETRSTGKKFCGMKPIEEINELKDIGRSMRMEKRNRQKRLSESCDDPLLNSSGRRKRRKATAPSDKIKKHKSSQQQASLDVQENEVDKSVIEDVQVTKKSSRNDQSWKELPRRKSPRTLKTTPSRLADEQAMEVILAACSPQVDENNVSKNSKVSNERRKSAKRTNSISQKKVPLHGEKDKLSNNDLVQETFAGGTRRATRAAKAQALASISAQTAPVPQKRASSATSGTSPPERRITRTMSKAKDTTHQNKIKQMNQRLAKTQALKSIVKGFGAKEDDEKDKNCRRSSRRSTSTTSRDKIIDGDVWDLRYQALIEFKKNKGHCLVPKVYPEDRQLSYWVFRQRGLYSNKQKKRGGSNSLSDERLQKLKDIGFVFRAKHSKEQNMVDAARRKPQLDAKWNKFYKEFCEYRKKTGSCLIPKVFEENQPLSSWAFTQRHHMKRRKDGKHNLLTEDRIKKLNDLGFIWHAKQNKEWQDADRIRKQAMVESMWQNHYKSLLAFKQKHGHTRVPKVYKENQAMSTWVFRQRAHYRRRMEGDEHALSDHRLSLLQKVDFQFRVRK